MLLHNCGFCNTCIPWNGGCTERWFSKQMHLIMLKFHNYFFTKQDCYKTKALLLYILQDQNKFITSGCMSQNNAWQSVLSGWNFDYINKIIQKKTPFPSTLTNTSFTLNVNLVRSQCMAHESVFVRKKLICDYQSWLAAVFFLLFIYSPVGLNFFSLTMFSSSSPECALQVYIFTPWTISINKKYLSI